MKTWNYKGSQSGYKTMIQRYPDGDIVMFQTVDSVRPGVHPEPHTAVLRFNEQELRDILNDKKRFPRQKKKSRKSKRGK